LNISDKQLVETSVQFDFICQVWLLFKIEDHSDKISYMLHGTQKLYFECEDNMYSISENNQTISQGTFEVFPSINELHIKHAEGKEILRIVKLSSEELVYECNGRIFYYSR
jgi:hypothetical protein